MDARISILKATIELISERWVIGYGNEIFPMVFAPHYPAQPAQLEGPGLVVDDPHNLILNELVASGTVGLVAFL